VAIDGIEAIVFLIGDRWIRKVPNTVALKNFEYLQLLCRIIFMIGIGSKIGQPEQQIFC
jgi:hypothetical protein